MLFCKRHKILNTLFCLVDNVKDKEVECGGAPPRVLVLDDYFMTEVEKVEKDPDTGKRVKKKVSLTDELHRTCSKEKYMHDVMQKNLFCRLWSTSMSWRWRILTGAACLKRLRKPWMMAFFLSLF